MTAAIYAHATPTKQREKLAEYLSRSGGGCRRGRRDRRPLRAAQSGRARNGL